jgi:cell division septation protein DedD
MHISHAALISTLTFAPFVLHGQAGSPPAPAAPVPAAPTPAAAPGLPSVLLQPALVVVESTLNAVKIDKWKKGSVRDEAGTNVNAMLRDLKTNLPPMVADADAAPGVLSKSIPLMKHLDALYDVLLRVEEASRVSAPSDQIDQLEDALKKFGIARIDLYDSLQQSAAGQEKQVTDLQTTLKAERAAAQAPKPAPAIVPCTPPKPAAKKKRPAPAKSTQTPPAQPKTAPATPPATQQPKTQ